MDKKTQQRLAQFGQQGKDVKRSFGLTRQAAGGPIKIDYGHDGERLFIVFRTPTDHVAMSVTQADDMIAAITSTRDRLKKHIAEGGGKVTQHMVMPE